ncbi:DUF159-domain-containing protein [Rickenella mellea]|uniref:DUF159-domain-containing protein n=1 Tax=Rickenella mellea TaxID=50990 RepID=A0A4Y7QGL3_9AGAM|nr:DUF159-domain-containing protein [Rickenella mellea]
MCGRFSLGLARHNIALAVQDAHPNMDLGEWVNEDAFYPRYNIAPHSQAPVVRRRNAPGAHQRASGSGSGTNSNENSNDNIASTSKPTASASSSRAHTTGGTTREEEEVVLHTMKWGLVPHWSKHEDRSLSTTNARSENLVNGGGMWKSIMGRKRCAVVCEGYYEWLNRGKDKLPHFTKHKDGKVMLLAGLYDVVYLEGSSEPLWSFTIVTTDACKEFEWLHDRQPVILTNDADLKTWLDTSSEAWSSALTQIVKPYHDDKRPLDCYQVPKEVGKVGTESASFIQPVALRKDGIQALFSKQKQTQSGGQAGTGSGAASSSKSKMVNSPVKTETPWLMPTYKAANKDAKRKRSESPVESKPDVKSKRKNVKAEKEGTSTMTTRSKDEKKKALVKDNNAPQSDEDDEDVKVAGASSSSSAAKSPTKRTPKKSPSKVKPAASGTPNARITQFFSQK